MAKIYKYKIIRKGRGDEILELCTSCRRDYNSSEAKIFIDKIERIGKGVECADCGKNEDDLISEIEPYTLDTALLDLKSVQLIDNTAKEADEARAEIERIIKALAGVV